MTEIELAFRERFRPLLLTGNKTATTRTSRKGRTGDVFRAFGGRFEITNVERVRLWFVAEECFKAEGLSSCEEFERVWVSIHPRRGYRRDDWVFLHRFRRIR